MSLLLMVRHGQASFHCKDYDRLSSLGVEQSRLLGTFWAERNLVIDRAYVGPRRRHWQTLETIGLVFRERGLAWPDPVELPELDEHSGQHVLTRCLPGLVGHHPSIRELAEKIQKGQAIEQRNYLKLFQQVTRMWVRGELSAPELEAWHEFRARVSNGIARMTAAGSSKQTIVAITSGGPIAAAVGLALSIDDEKTLELSWIVRNAACTEFLFSGQRFSLVAFNTTPHLPEQRLWTYL
jgi:broad specificity phosphatase PhoE